MGDGRWPRLALPCRARLGIGLVLACNACARVPAPPPARPPASLPVPAPAPPLLPVPRLKPASVTGGAGELSWSIIGQGSDTVIIPLGSWLAPALAPLADRRVLVFYDPRHRGRSHALTDTTAATFEGDVDDLEAVRAALGASRVHVIAFDYYAAVAAAWAAAHPAAIRRLVLLAPIEPHDSLARDWNPPGRMARLDTVAARHLVKDRAAGRDTTDPVAYCRAFWRVNAPLFVHDATRTPPDTWCDLPNESPAALARASGLALSSLGSGSDFGARATGLTAPTLVIHGRQDLVANPEGARDWARRIPAARVLWLSIGHLPHVESGPVVIDAVAEFLGGRWPPRAAPPE